MPTLAYEISSGDGWVEVATSAQDCVIESQSSVPLLVTFQTSAPGPDTAYHTVYGREAFIRVGTDSAYIRTKDTNRKARVVVTT